MVNPLQAILLSRDITDANNEFLMKDITDEKTLEAVKQINTLKAPGPRWYVSFFYQKNRDIVGSLIFVSGYMLKELNRTYITLIPGTANPDNVKHYRH